MAPGYDVIVDFETASAIDLKKSGAARYAQDPTTEILCLVWEVQGTLDWWSPYLDNPGAWERLAALVSDPAATFVSYAMFEQWVWRYIMEPLGMPPLPIARWHDAQAVAAWHGHPLKLEILAREIELPIQKDMEGSKVTIALSKAMTKAAWAADYPGPSWGPMAAWMRDYPEGILDRSPATFRRVIDYCKIDVRTEAAAHQKLGRLSAGERKVWELDQDINHRGMRIDLDFVRAAQRVVERAKVPLEAEFRELTGGLGSGQRDKIMEWCASRGAVLDNLTKEYLGALLGDGHEEGEEREEWEGDEEPLRGGQAPLGQEVRRALEIRSMLGSVSIRKLERMLACTCFDGRARGLTQYHAAGTGRWGGRLFQPHNFPWDKGGVMGRIDPEAAVTSIMSGDPEYVEMMTGAPAIAAVAMSLRHALVPDPGKVFLVGDYAGIEARLVLALAGQHDKTALMAAGHDVYLDMACDIYNVPKGSLTKADGGKRLIGKNATLGCGFQMGGDKFHGRYCPEQSAEFARGVVETYRTIWAPKVPEVWRVFKDAVYQCGISGRTVEAYGCTFMRQGHFMTIDLPSGWQRLWYYRPALRDRGDDYGFAPSYRASKNGRPQILFLYGGIVTENIVQALARGLLCTAMGRLTQAGMPVVMTVHDEIICEVDEAKADEAEFKRIMEIPTEWTEKMQVPIAVETWSGMRYRK